MIGRSVGSPTARALGAGVTLVIAAAIGCADLGTDPLVTVAIEFDSVPFPAVIAGDSLRDSAGVARPLRAVAYNGAGDVIPSPAVTYFALDTGVVIDAAGFLRATRRDGPVRLLASAGGLQSIVRTVQVTRRPDSLAGPTTRTFTFPYLLPDRATNVTTALSVNVLSDDVAGGVSPNVAGWLVRWRVVHDGDTLTVTDTTHVALLEGSRRQLLDTTGTDGGSARTLRIFADRLTVAQDSFIVVAEVRRHGTLLRGSPVRFVVNVAPASP